MPRRGAKFAFLLAAGCLGAGCDPSVQPIEVAPGCPDQPVRGPAQFPPAGDRLISDFELGSTNLAPVAGRDGSWIIGAESTSVSHVGEPSSRCAARGAWGGHFAARGFSSWGVNWTAVFRNAGGGPAVPYDGRAFSGISFWAAFGGDNGAPFEVPVGIVTMDTAWNGGICSPCTDHYMTKVALTSSWQRFVVRFADMAQAGTGLPQLPMRRDQLVGFVVWPDRNFDLWIDDVRFEPAGS
ncbi:MAG: hypothetical protein JXP73_21760 [Deltaproteobacteria bacterium]|nr:hypothetical protein [Deltaproteobacteria bacterium]